MDVATMINRLAVRLEDADKTKLTDIFKLKALNNAQQKLPQFLHNDYLSELQHFKESLAITTGATAALTASSLGYDLLRSGQGVLTVRDGRTNTYMQQLSLADLKGNENRYQKGSVQKPYFYIAGNKIYVLPTTGITVIDVYILRKPATLYYTYTASSGEQNTIVSQDTNLSVTDDYYNGLYVYNETKDSYNVVLGFAYSSPNYTITLDEPGAGTAGANSDIFYFLSGEFDNINKAGVTCELNACLHELVLLLAEAECWSMDKKPHRRQSALSAAYAEIQVLNSRYAPAEGIGTSAEKRFFDAMR